MIWINQRLESKTTVSVLAHFLGTDDNIRAEIHRLSREGAKSWCTWQALVLLLHHQWHPMLNESLAPITGNIFLQQPFSKCWPAPLNTDFSDMQECWEGAERGFQNCRNSLKTDGALNGPAEALHRSFRSQWNWRRQGALAQGQRTSAPVHTEQQLQGNHCSPLLGTREAPLLLE